MYSVLCFPLLRPQDLGIAEFLAAGLSKCHSKLPPRLDDQPDCLFVRLKQEATASEELRHALAQTHCLLSQAGAQISRVLRSNQVTAREKLWAWLIMLDSYCPPSIFAWPNLGSYLPPSVRAGPNNSYH